MSWRPSQALILVAALILGFFVVRALFGSGTPTELPTVAGTQPQVPIATIAVGATTTPVIQAGTPATTPNAAAAPVQIAAAGDTAATTVVDEAALRYFARQGDTVRLQAEIARLRALYPTWTPPADPLATPVYTDPESDRMWALYSEGRFAEVRTAIADRQLRQPGWSPPAALLDLLAIGEARDRLIAASNARQYDQVIVTAASTPALLVCSEMDVMWRVAEAFAATDREERAKDVYVYILGTCDVPEERFATMQKAINILSADAFDALYTYERLDAAGQPEFDAFRTEEARRRLAEGGDNDTIVLSPDQIQRMEEAARAGDGPEDALLLGWYYQLRDEARRAEPWFRLAFQRAPTAESAQGLALALIDLDRAAEAEDTLYAFREDSEDEMAVYLAAVATLLAEEPVPDLTPAILRRIVETVGDQRDNVGARQLGWYAYKLSQVATAAQWFQTALNWGADDEEAAYGLAVSMQRLQNTTALNTIVQQWGSRSLRVRALVDPAAARELERMGTLPANTIVPTLTPMGGVTTAPVTTTTTPVTTTVAATTTTTAAAGGGGGGTSCTRTVNPETLSPGAALTRGWCLMELDRPTEAAAAFGVALRSTSATTRSDAAYGQSLAYLRLGVTDRAAIAATQAEMTPTRATEVQANILSQRALAAYHDGAYVEALRALDERARIAGEQNDLMVIRGYSYMYLGNLAAAQWVFEAIANAGFPDARDGLAEVERRSRIFTE